MITLDLAPKCVGWAYGPLTQKAPSFGHWLLPKFGGEAARYVALANTLYDTIRLWKPAHMVIERALPPEAQTDRETCENQLGLRAIAIEAAGRHCISRSEVDAWTVRMSILGRASFPGKGQTKLEVMRYLISIGIAITIHDEADAVMLWLWHRRQVTGLGPVAGPLFRDKELVA